MGIILNYYGTKLDFFSYQVLAKRKNKYFPLQNAKIKIFFVVNSGIQIAVRITRRNKKNPGWHL